MKINNINGDILNIILMFLFLHALEREEEKFFFLFILL